MHWTRLAFSSAVLLALLAGVAPGQDTTTQPAGDADVETGGAKATGTVQGTGTAIGTGTVGQKARDVPWWGGQKLMLIMLGGIFLLWFWMGRGRKKEQKKRKEMLDSLRKGDKVTTAGGIIGTVVDIRDDDVTLKVDESANVRMKFLRGAIRHVGDPKADKSEDDKR